MLKNRYNKKLLPLFAIALSVFALYAYRFLPEKRYVVTDDPTANIFIYGTDLPNGQSSALWLNQSERQFRCVYPEGIADYSYYCSFNVGYPFGEGKGIDLSQFQRIKLSVEYNGAAPKMRFFARNFSSAYSKPDDFNSAKYNAIFLATKDLDNEITLNLSEFVVTEWWLLTYDITRENSFPELNNVVNLGIDFSDSMTVGNHDIRIKKIELAGVWITRENWYLGIMCLWLAGVFATTISQLIKIRKQLLRDKKLISDLNESNQKLIKESDKFKKLSTIDTLTQSYNRFGIDQIVSTLMASARQAVRGKPPFALILLDIDHFKQVNDSRGHDAGDRILKKLAEIVRKNTREGDYVGRWGGEEFIIILPFTSDEVALSIAEKLRLSVSRSRFEPNDPLVVTISAGVGSHTDGEVFADVFKRVDDALYEAKNGGRNRCVLAEPELTSHMPVAR